MTEPSTISVAKLITADHFTGFITSARDFCDFIENNTTEGSLLFLRLTQIHLQTFYIGGQQLQSVDLIINKDFEHLLTEAESQNILNRLSNKLGKNRFYWHVFDPTNEKDIEPVCGDLLDDLGDIYKELKNAILLFDKGTAAEIESAVWTMKWSYDNHWGTHCINAIYGLHYFIRLAP